MTKSEVERNARTASRLRNVSPSGVTAFPLLAARPATGRSGRRVGQTALRIGLRVLVAGGFAGAAWLLSASAAQAARADAAPALGDLPVVSAVDGLGNGLLGDDSTTGRERSVPRGPARDGNRASSGAPVGRSGGLSAPLGAVVAPVAKAASTALHSGAASDPTSILDATPAIRSAGGSAAGHSTGGSGRTKGVPSGAGSASTAGTSSLLGSLTSDRAGLGAVVGVVQGLVARSGLAGKVTRVSPLFSTIDPVVAPLSQGLRSVSGLPNVGAPAAAVDDPAVRAGGGSTDEPTGSTADSCGSDRPDVAETSTVEAGRAMAGSGRTTSVARSFTGTEPRAAGTPDARTGTNEAPGQPYQGPLGSYPGVGTGIPAGASGSPSEGGAFAVLPSSVAASTVDVHQLPVATDVADLRHESGVPTVSPD
jgi:hypothetical protein